MLTQLLKEWPWLAPTAALASVAMSATTVVFVLLDRRCRSQSAISWVLLVMVAPFVGPIIYWMFGKPWLSEHPV
ncbi:MAG: PLDc N-terminal domain-containing protein, partial [bacterium]